MFDVEKTLSMLTLEEKAGLASGLYFWTTKPIERLNIPPVTMTDGPHGLRKEFGIDEGKGGVNIMKGSEPATCFPTAATMASSWDQELVGKVGEAIGEEAKSLRVSTVLGPGINIKRSPLCGRNFEYFSEDPFLTAELAKSFIDGVQSVGVGTSLKHFACNNEEYNRMSIDSVVDERALREIYLYGFEQAVKESQPQQIMASYNRVDGTYVSENKRLLTDILRSEWGFKGIVVSDWGAVNDRVEGVKAGLDLQMPGTKGVHDKMIVKAVQNGTLLECDLDKVVLRVLNYINDCLDKKQEDYKCDFTAHHELCRQVGTKSAVLLKNDDSILPVRKEENVALIGKLAEVSRYQGSGSSRICCKNLVNILDAFKANQAKFEYAEGYTLDGNGKNKKLLQEAINVAKGKDKIILIIGLTDVYESEGFDRSHLSIPDGHIELVEEIAKVNPNVIVVLEGGSPVVMPWQSKAKAILNTYLLGEAVGESTYDLIYGNANPSGKLAETYPENLDDCLSQKYFPMGPKTVEYRESIFVGYRYFDTARKSVLYPFGYGLSYTTFEYSSLEVNKEFNKGKKLAVSFTITNTGKQAGEEIAQVYIRHKNSPVFKPDKELKAFKKVSLDVNESKKITVYLDDRSFSFYNTAVNDWSIIAGEYEIIVGASSRDIRLSTNVSVNADEVALPDMNGLSAYFELDSITDIPTDSFEKLYGKPLPDNTPLKKGEFHENTTIGETTITGLGKFIVGLCRFVSKLIASESLNSEMIIRSVESMPIRGLCGFSGGILSMHSIYGLVDMFNGTKGGFRKFLAGFKKKNK